MKKKWLVGLFAAGILFGAAKSGAQGLVWQTQLKGEQIGSQQMTTAFVPGMVLLSDMNAEGDAVIFRLDRKMLYFVKHSEKKVNAYTFEEFDAEMSKMRSMIDAQMSKAMKELQNLPAEQRAMIEKQLGPLMPKKEEGPVTVERKGDQKSIAGYPAVRYVATQNGEPMLTAWTTTAVPGWKEMRKEFAIYLEKMSGINQLSKSFVAAAKQIDGFPLEMELAGFTSTVTKVEAKATPASAFEIPAGYTLEKKKLFDEEMKEEREE
jgi:hypothetical protein